METKKYKQNINITPELQQRIDELLGHYPADKKKSALLPVSDQFEIVDLPAPEALRDSEGFVDYSYINHLVVNGGVLACAFGDPADDRAQGVLREAYPGREIVAIDARPLFARGGGIHCITQQQPSVSV